MNNRKVTKKKRYDRPEREKPRFCDPFACRNCQHIGKGTFTCNIDPLNPVGVVVVSGWKATEKYLHCKRRRGR